MDGAGSKVVGILGEDPLTSRILGLLLAGVGHEARVLDATDVLAEPGGALAGLDLVLLAPSIGGDREVELLDAIEGAPATAAVPVLGLSSALKANPNEREERVPWPCSVETLVGAIERAVLAPAPGGGEASS